MKKKIIIIVSIIVVLMLAFGGAYLIDKNRMDNNKPVIFSTWGYDYAPPEEIIAPPKLYMKLETKCFYFFFFLEEFIYILFVLPTIQSIEIL